MHSRSDCECVAPTIKKNSETAMKRSLTSVATAAALLITGTHAALAAEQISVLHWWTSGYEWKDFAIAGGAGAAAMTALKTQVISGNAPSAAQIKGPLIQDWAEQGSLVTIDQAATDWKAHTPARIDSAVKAGGHYVAAPFSVHRINWLWINK